MKAKRTIFCLIFTLLLFGTVAVEAQTQKQLFEKANQYYNEAVYDSALAVYQNLLAANYASDALYYNIGNTYFKLKDLPSAILYYEKALKINPSDEDIKNNLQIANSMIVDKIEVIPQLFFRVWWKAFYNMLPANSWGWISVVIFLLTLAAVYVYLTSPNTGVRKLTFFAGLVLVFLTIASFGLASQKYYYTRQTNEAIIFAPTITVKSSPAQSSVDLFVLHEGTKVALLDKTNGWVKIRISNGSVGWLPENTLEGI